MKKYLWKVYFREKLIESIQSRSINVVTDSKNLRDAVKTANRFMKDNKIIGFTVAEVYYSGEVYT